MKLTKSISKNMKILARSKGSALVVLLAPLIIVFIIGIGFMDSTETTLNIGIHTKQPSDLTQRYINSLNTTEHNIIIYNNEEKCKNSISEGLTVLCAIFSEDFELKDNAKNELTFYVDESRLNLVDKLTASFSNTTSSETSEISEELAKQLLQIIEITNTKTTESLALIIQNKAQINTASTELEKADTSITGLDTAKESITTSTLQTKIDEIEVDFKELRTQAIKVIDEAKKLNLTDPEEQELQLQINNLNIIINNSTGIKNIEELQVTMNIMTTRLDKLTQKIEQAENVQKDVIENLQKLKSSIQTLQTNTDTLKTKQEQIISEIESFNLKTARSISNPIQTNIESVSSTNNRLTYSFSYLLTLAILFVGLMLSSTLVFMEKDSKAFFRNFTTPTSQKYFTLINYLTSLIIIVIQTIVILIIAHYTLNVPILTNPVVTSIFLFLGITLFIYIGLLIGTLSTTSEAVTMSTIVLGSIFLFLSNLILPLETLSPIVSKIAAFNPYVIISESIRKSMLFEASIQQTYPEMMMLISYIAIIITIMILVNNLGLKHYLASRRHKKNILITEPENLIIRIKNEDKKIKNISELIETLKLITDEEYQELIKQENTIQNWLKNNLKEKTLSNKIKNKKLKDVIKKLEEHQHKKDKKINKKQKTKN